MTTQEERALRERAQRLGFKLSRRGSEYNLIGPDGTGFGGSDINGINWWLDVGEHKLPVQISSACGTPLFEINADAHDPQRGMPERAGLDMPSQNSQCPRGPDEAILPLSERTRSCVPRQLIADAIDTSKSDGETPIRNRV